MRLSAFFLALFLAVTVRAETFIVGAQNIQYYPHYDFQSSIDKGLGWAILEAYAKESGHTFSYHAMPILRLQRELAKGNVDFVYPDNPKWYVPRAVSSQKHFSVPLVQIVGGTIIKPHNRGKGIDSITRLAVPRGFSPVNWQNRIDQKLTRLVEVKDSITALQLLQLDRVDATNLELNVVQHFASTTPELGPFTLDPALPYTVVGFRLSTIRHPALVDDFSRFITQNQALITALYERYQIRQPAEILQQ